MKSFNKVIAIAVTFIILMFATVNIVPKFAKEKASILKVEVSRIVREIKETGDIPDNDRYTTYSVFIKIC